MGVSKSPETVAKKKALTSLGKRSAALLPFVAKKRSAKLLFANGGTGPERKLENLDDFRVESEEDWEEYKRLLLDTAAVYNQKGPTCWAHAISTVIDLATRRIIGREGGYTTFRDIRRELFTEFGRKGISRLPPVLKAVVPRLRLRYDLDIGIDGAREAVMIGKRPVVAKFALTGKEWLCFSVFFHRKYGTPLAVLDAESLDIHSPLVQERIERAADAHDEDENDEDEEDDDDDESEIEEEEEEEEEDEDKKEGHVVVLVDVEPDCLVFHNSWGSNFGYKGRFRVRDETVLRRMKFYDIFFYESDLSESEREEF